MDPVGGDVSVVRTVLALLGTVLLVFASLFFVAKLKFGGKFLFRDGGGKRVKVVDMVRFGRTSGVALVSFGGQEYLCPFGGAGAPVKVSSSGANSGMIGSVGEEEDKTTKITHSEDKR